MFSVLLLLFPLVFGQQCLPGQDLGPCQAGGACDAGQICVTDTPDGIFVCCPFADVFTTTTTTTSATPTCVDKINPSTGRSDCPNVAYLCTNPAYKDLMKDQCPKTCGFCGVNTNPGNTVCQDKINQSTGQSDCPNVKYLCSNPQYIPLMKEQCPKTCGFC